MGLDLLAPHLVDAESTIGSALDRVRAAGEHAKVKTVVVLLLAVMIDCDDRLETAGSRRPDLLTLYEVIDSRGLDVATSGGVTCDGPTIASSFRQ